MGKLDEQIKNLKTLNDTIESGYKSMGELLAAKQQAEIKLAQSLCRCECGEDRFLIYNSNPIADQTALEIYCSRCYKKQD